MTAGSAAAPAAWPCLVTSAPAVNRLVQHASRGDAHSDGGLAKAQQVDVLELIQVVADAAGRQPAPPRCMAAVTAGPGSTACQRGLQHGEDALPPLRVGSQDGGVEVDGIHGSAVGQGSVCAPACVEPVVQHAACAAFNGGQLRRAPPCRSARPAWQRRPRAGLRS